MEITDYTIVKALKYLDAIIPMERKMVKDFRYSMLDEVLKERGLTMSLKEKIIHFITLMELTSEVKQLKVNLLIDITIQNMERKLNKLKLDIVNRDSMALNPLDWDPYESKFIEIKQTKNMGEGMFAKRDIPQGHLCSLYAGILYPHYIVDRRKWELNSNTIEVDN